MGTYQQWDQSYTNKVQTIRLSHNDYSEWYSFVQANCEDFISNQYNGYNIKNDKASVINSSRQLSIL